MTEQRRASGRPLAGAQRERHRRPPAAPDWYKDAILYELHLRAFRDSNGDGVGDLRGLTEKLDYLVDLGVTAIWLLPFFPSPGRDDGYDIADYTAVHPRYGTLDDVRTLLAEAHRRGLRVIGELVLNHTSDQHPWFQRARRAPPGSPWRDFYVWSDTPGRYADARIIFTDTETSNWAWDPVAGAYYWHRFYAHQPDLNYEHPDVRAEVLAAVDFWLDLGLDGVRLDAVPYLFEADGTSCENLPATHAFLRELRRHVDERYGDRMLLAEANQWPEDAVAYFGGGDGDECHMAFHFPLMPRIFMALRVEDRFPIVDILDQTPPIPETAQWAIFLRNHDELTLEMVTDEERDYLYRAYAADPAARINLGIRRRLAPLAGTRRRLELLFSFLFSMPGTPVIYYGDEIGMGDNYFLGDRDAVRTPMQWSSDRNAGFSEANRQRLYLPLIVDPEFHFEAVNVAAQEANPQSLLWWIKRVIGIRRRHPAFARGSFRLIPTPNPRVLAYLRTYGDETLLVVANLSRYAQWCELDLSEHAGRRVVELFGGTPFPVVTPTAYPMTVGPHSFLWFRLEPPDAAVAEPPAIGVESPDPLDGLLAQGERGTPLARALGRWLVADPDVRLQGALPASTRIEHAQVLQLGDRRTVLVLVRTDTQAAEALVVPVLLELGGRREGPSGWATSDVIARVRRRDHDEETDLVDVSRDPGLQRLLAARVAERSPRDRMRARPIAQPARRRRSPVARGGLEPVALLAGRAEPAPLPEAEVARDLLAAGAPVEPIVASLEVETAAGMLAVGVVAAARDPGTTALADEAAGSLDRLIDAALAAGEAAIPARFRAASALGEPLPPARDETVARELAEITTTATQVGECLAALHDALAADGAPTAGYSAMDRRALYQEGRTHLGALAAPPGRGAGADGLPDGGATVTPGGGEVTGPRPGEGRADDDRVAQLLDATLAARGGLDGRLREVLERRLDGLRIPRYGPPLVAARVLRDGSGRHVIGPPEPDRRVRASRTRLRSPLLDVAALLHSLASITLRPLLGPGAGAGVVRGDADRVGDWARTWWGAVAGSLVRGYLAALRRRELVPADPADFALLLDVHLIGLALEHVVDARAVGEPVDAVDLVMLLDLAGAPGASPASGSPPAS